MRRLIDDHPVARKLLPGAAAILRPALAGDRLRHARGTAIDVAEDREADG